MAAQPTPHEFDQRIAAAPTPLRRLELLHQAASALCRDHPRRALEYAGEACQIAVDLNRGRDRGESLLLMGNCRGLIGAYAPALRDYRSALRLFRRVADSTGESRAVEGLGTIYLRQGLFARAFTEFRRAVALWRGTDEPAKAAAPLLNIGIIYATISEFEKALVTLAEVLDIVEKEAGGEERWEMIRESALNTTAGVYKHLSDYTTAATYLQRALALAEARGERRAVAVTRSNLGALLIDMGEHEAGRALVEGAIVVAREMENREWEARFLGTLAVLHEHLGELETAEELVRTALTLAESIDAKQACTSSRLWLGTILRRAGRMEEALVELLAVREEAQRLGLRQSEQDAEEQLAQAYESLGDSASALHHLRAHLALASDIEGAARQRAAVEMRLRSTIERMEREQDALRREQTRLQEEQGRSAEALLASSMEIADRDHLLERLRDRAARIADGDAEAAVLARGMLRDIEGIGGGRDRLDGRLLLLHADLREVLVRRFPALTPAELRVCLLVSAGMSSQEIADLLGVGYRTVETHRCRARSVLGLERSTNLTTFLQSL